MIPWTDSARAKIETYFAQVRQTLEASGADADEVIEDLRRHVNEEAASLKLTVITGEDIDRILNRIGAPQPDKTSPAAEPSTTAPQPGQTPFVRIIGNGLLLFLGVLLPLITIAFELFTGACAGVLFDPFPLVGSIVLVALVPLANLLTWVALRRNDMRYGVALGWFTGIAAGVSAVYALLFLPISPFAAIGIIYFGLGLIPLSPLLALVATLVFRSKLRRAGNSAVRLPRLWHALALGIIAVFVCSIPMLLTEIGLKMAVSEDSAESRRGVGLLRKFGDEERLLRFCYGSTGRAEGIYQWGKPINPEEARSIYYRVTGQAFNATPPPRLYAGRARWDLLDQEFAWDSAQGGESVGGHVKGLSLAGSRQDGVVDGDAVLGYLEWTLEFKNDGPMQREARAQIALPPGGVVSRLTLWIDGEEREAAFGGRSQVKGAYKEIVQRRRDPVLVTTCGPDRVMVQCFPVPANGGRMKVRFGITAPLILTNASAGFLQWPRFLERNFGIAEDFKHSLWLESKKPLEIHPGGLVIEKGPTGSQIARGTLSDADLAEADNAVRVTRDPSVKKVWCPDAPGTNGPIVIQTIEEMHPLPPERVIFVVDGTRGTERFLPDAADSILQLPERAEFSVILAADDVTELTGPPRRADSIACRDAAAMLRHVKCEGGHDNVPALVRALDLAAESTNGIVIWIHGPQPVLPGNDSELVQRLERQSGGLHVLEIQTKAGPNRLAEQLDGIDALQSLPRLGNLRSDLERLFGSWRGSSPAIRLTRSRAAPTTLTGIDRGKQVSSHLVRLWAADEVKSLRAARKFKEATTMATTHQLVTPASGAVVLETRQQFAQAGLQPVDPATVPVVPEPSTGFLLIVGTVIIFVLRRRRRMSGAF